MSAGRPKSKLTQEERIRARLGVYFDDLGKQPDVELARLLGVSHERVRQYRALLGIPRYRKPPHPYLDAIVTAWNQGKSGGVIARELGVNKLTVLAVLRLGERRGAALRSGYSSTRLPPGGPTRKWTPATIEPIRQLWCQGATARELAVALDLKNAASAHAWVHRRRQAGYDFPRKIVEWTP